MAEELQQAVVKQTLALLRGGQAHATLEDAVAGFPVALRGTIPPGLPYSAWQLLEHLRIAQADILEFSDPPVGGYQHRKWPEAYWPKSAEPPDASSWDECIAALEADRRQFEALLTQSGADLATPFPWGDGQNLLRQALLMADHNAYHTGELVLLRRLLGCWKS
jgi:hypothetical protein